MVTICFSDSYPQTQTSQYVDTLPSDLLSGIKRSPHSGHVFTIAIITIFTSIPPVASIIKCIVFHVWLIPKKRKSYRFTIRIDFVSHGPAMGAFCFPASKIWYIGCNFIAQTHGTYRLSKFIFPNGLMPTLHENSQLTTFLSATSDVPRGLPVRCACWRKHRQAIPVHPTVYIFHMCLLSW